MLTKSTRLPLLRALHLARAERAKLKTLALVAIALATGNDDLVWR